MELSALAIVICSIMTSLCWLPKPSNVRTPIKLHLRVSIEVLAKQVDFEIKLWDFFDWSAILQKHEKVASTGMVLTVATAIGGRMVGGYGWVDGALGAAKVVGNNSLRRLIVPGILATGK
jgi:hypothetical protein